MTPARGRSLTSIALLGAICLVAVNTWLAFDSVGKLEESQHWVQHTYRVIAQVETIMGLAKDAETGERGYLITGDQRFLEPFEKAVREIPAQLDGFGALVEDNPRQQLRLEQMRASMIRRIELLRLGISLRHGGESMSEAALKVTGNGKNEMDTLRQIADGMQNEERSLLAGRSLVQQSDSLRAHITVGLASALDFILVLLMFRYFVRERAMRVASEMTAQKLAEAREQAEANAREILVLNTNLEERVRVRTAELETINRELEAFSYSVSHDLRAPLRTVDGFSLALEEDYSDVVDDAGKDYIRRVRSGVQRMGQLIDALLQLSRITRAELERTDFDMSVLVETIAIPLGQENIGRNLQFKIQPGLQANGDPRLIRVALENLLGNAVKFSSKVDMPVVEFGWDEANKAWFVRDNGAGFDMDYSNKLFHAFNRLHGDKDFKGSGIGLATVARVIRRHHGRIWAQSEVNHGATFWFTLE